MMMTTVEGIVSEELETLKGRRFFSEENLGQFEFTEQHRREMKRADQLLSLTPKKKVSAHTDLFFLW